MSVLFDIPPGRLAALHAIRDRHLGTATSTQRERLLEALQTLGHVTTFEAMRFLDIFDPRPRKLELVADGYMIVTSWRTAYTEAQIMHRIGVYTLIRGLQRPTGAPYSPLEKEKASDATSTPKASKSSHRDDIAQLDFTPEAAAWAIQAGIEAGQRALQMLGGGNPYASIAAITEAIKAFGAAADSIRVLIGG